MNVYYLVLRGGRWSVIMLSMIQVEQTSHLSPYCNESMFRNSNYLFDRLTNDKNSSIPVDKRARTAVSSHTNKSAHLMTEPGSRWPLTPAVTSPLILFLDQTSLCTERPAKARACSRQPPSPPAIDIVFSPDWVVTQMDYICTWNKHACPVYLQKSDLIL